LGGELLAKGISLVAVTALLVSWVTVGSVQLPAEALMLGSRFALYRNLLVNSLNYTDSAGRVEVSVDRTVDSHIKKLRKKLVELQPDHELIHSVYGAGYRYESGVTTA
jgi:DNA-binding response OmpR family regulator